MILGGGPNRIGQGIEFDYCCVQAAFAARELGFESVMINSNPETVSTDYDTSDLLFFEPLTLEDVLNVCERLNGRPLGEAGGLLHGVIVQLGGQTPLNLASGLEAAGVPIIGTSVASIELAEDRDHFSALCRRLGVKQPANGIAQDVESAVRIANDIGYPVLVRPSFVLGGRAMETVFDDAQLRRYMAAAIGASDLAGQPILIDKFLFQATECDVDVVADYDGDATTQNPGTGVVCGILEHIEEAGIHSGDSACVIPPHSLSEAMRQTIREASLAMARELQVRGLMNVQWAVRHEDGGDTLYVIEVNPRASRTVPFVGKATGVPWASIAAKVMMGRTLAQLGVDGSPDPPRYAIKESVFPFAKFPGVDVVLGPEMRSTGEVMGTDPDFGLAFAKAQLAAGQLLPTEGAVFLSVRAEDKPEVLDVARGFAGLGFDIWTTRGTQAFLEEHGIATRLVRKIQEGGRPNALDLITNGDVSLIVNTPTRKGAGTDEGKLRAAAVRHGVTMITTLTGAACAVKAVRALREGDWGVSPLQDW